MCDLCWVYENSCSFSWVCREPPGACAVVWRDRTERFSYLPTFYIPPLWSGTTELMSYKWFPSSLLKRMKQYVHAPSSQFMASVWSCFHRPEDVKVFHEKRQMFICSLSYLLDKSEGHMIIQSYDRHIYFRGIFTWESGTSECLYHHPPVNRV